MLSKLSRFPRPTGDSRTSPENGQEGFSLVELLLVMAIAGALLALAAPALLEVGPSRKAATMELAGFLDRARAEAVAKDRIVYVAVANANHPEESLRFRSYAYFIDESDPADEEALSQRAVRQISEWMALPEGLAFSSASLFSVEPGYSFRTIHDLNRTRVFPLSSGNSTALPYLAYSSSGEVLYPSIITADALHLAVVEGTLNNAGNGIQPFSESGDGQPRGELIRISAYTGKAAILTD